MNIVKFTETAPECIPMQPFMFKAQFVRKRNASLVRWNDANKYSLKIQLLDRYTQDSRDCLGSEALSF